MGVIKHSKSTQSNNSEISLQYLNKGVRNGVHFLHADKHWSFYKLVLLFFYGSDQTPPLILQKHFQLPILCTLPKIGSWKCFCNILRKKFRNCFFVLLWCKTFRYFTGVQSCSLLLFFSYYDLIRRNCGITFRGFGFSKLPSV